jgi:hypothetical protein
MSTKKHCTHIASSRRIGIGVLVAASIAVFCIDSKPTSAAQQQALVEAGLPADAWNHIIEEIDWTDLKKLSEVSTILRKIACNKMDPKTRKLVTVSCQVIPAEVQYKIYRDIFFAKPADVWKRLEARQRAVNQVKQSTPDELRARLAAVQSIHNFAMRALEKPPAADASAPLPIIPLQQSKIGQHKSEWAKWTIKIEKEIKQYEARYKP